MSLVIFPNGKHKYSPFRSCGSYGNRASYKTRGQGLVKSSNLTWHSNPATVFGNGIGNLYQPSFSFQRRIPPKHMWNIIYTRAIHALTWQAVSPDTAMCIFHCYFFCPIELILPVIKSLSGVQPPRLQVWHSGTERPPSLLGNHRRMLWKSRIKADTVLLVFL